MKLLEQTEPGANGLVVQRCGLWRYNSIAVVSGSEACVVDPGITPEEVGAMRDHLAETGRKVTTVLLTHSHHDHIRGWDAFPGAQVVAPRIVAEKDDGPRARILAGKRKVDERMGVDDSAFRYPEVDVAFEEQHVLKVGDLEVHAKFLPGHSNCTSVAVVPALGIMLTADYLVSPGLPYCRWEPAPYESANRWIGEETRRLGLTRAIPAHNDFVEGTDAILDAVGAEHDYFQDLRAFIDERLAEDTPKEALLRAAERHMGERRGEDLGPRARQDGDNARRVLAERTARPS